MGEADGRESRKESKKVGWRLHCRGAETLLFRGKTIHTGHGRRLGVEPLRINLFSALNADSVNSALDSLQGGIDMLQAVTLHIHQTTFQIHRMLLNRAVS